VDFSVIYIIGDVRSGSTLLDYLLSCHPQVVSVGEMHRLSDFYFKKSLLAKSWKYKCSCGKILSECTFWKNIVEESNLPEDFETAITFHQPLKSALNKRKQIKSMKGILESAVFFKEENIAKNCWNIYEQISKQTGKRIIIDSSKNAFQAIFLDKQKRTEIKFLLLERDIKSVAYSKMKRINDKRQFVGNKVNNIFYQLVGSFLTVKTNRNISEVIKQISGTANVKKINYMQLTTEPETTIKDICNWLNIESYTIPEQTLTTNNIFHVIGGSPSRYEKKKIQPDFKSDKYFENHALASAIGNFLKVALKN